MKTTKQKYRNFLTFILLLSLSTVFAQVGINTTDPADGSILDITSSDKGIFIPRIELTNLTTMAPITGIANNPTDLANAEGLMVYNTSTTTGPGFFVWSGTNWTVVGDNNDDWKRNGNSGTDPINNFLGTTDTQPLRFSTNGTEQARIDENGVVGVGTTSPATSSIGGVNVQRLNVIGNQVAGAAMSEIVNSGNGVSLIAINSSTTNSSSSIEGGTNGSGAAIRGIHKPGLTPDYLGSGFGIYGISNSWDGIGVYGASGAIIGIGDTGAAGYFDGDLFYSGDAYTLSDKRLKENINTYSGALNKLKLLKTYSYKFNNLAPQFQSKYEIGFIAQEMEEIFPNLVKEKRIIKTGKNEKLLSVSEQNSAIYKTVNYTGLIPILTQAIKEQQEKITSLEKRLESLEKAMGKRN